MTTCISIIEIVNLSYTSNINFGSHQCGGAANRNLTHCGRIDDQLLLLFWASNTTTKTNTNTNTNTNVDSNIDLRPTSISLLAIEENKESMRTY